MDILLRSRPHFRRFVHVFEYMPAPKSCRIVALEVADFSRKLARPARPAGKESGMKTTPKGGPETHNLAQFLEVDQHPEVWAQVCHMATN